MGLRSELCSTNVWSINYTTLTSVRILAVTAPDNSSNFLQTFLHSSITSTHTQHSRCLCVGWHPDPPTIKLCCILRISIHSEIHVPRSTRLTSFHSIRIFIHHTIKNTLNPTLSKSWTNPQSIHNDAVPLHLLRLTSYILERWTVCSCVIGSVRWWIIFCTELNDLKVWALMFHILEYINYNVVGN